MLSEFIIKPEKVIEKFYDKCEVRFSLMKSFNKKNLVHALKDLKSNDLTSRLTDAKYKIFSIYSSQDGIVNIDTAKIKKIEKENHQISILPDLSHGFPHTKPDLCLKIIKDCIKKI